MFARSDFSWPGAITYSRTTLTTTLRMWAPGDYPMDLYRATIGPGTGGGSLVPGPGWLLPAGPPGPSPACFRSDLQGSPGSQGGSYLQLPLTQSEDSNPPVGTATFYVFTHDALDGSSVNALGCANPAVCLGGPEEGRFCASDAECGAQGTCLNLNLSATPPTGPFSCPPNGDPRKVVRQVDPSAVCP